MKQLELFEIDNGNIKERYDLAVERITMMMEEHSVALPYRSYFYETGAFLLKINDVYQLVSSDRFKRLSLADLKVLNAELYYDILPQNYGMSYADPAYAVEELGEIYGNILSFLYVELRGLIPSAFEQRLVEIVSYMELFIEIYNLFEETSTYKSIREAIYSFIYDNLDNSISLRIAEQLDPNYDFAVNIIMEEDLNDLRYLYYYGDYISDNEIKTAQFLNTLPQTEIEAMAATYTEGFKDGFKLAGIDLAKKKSVNLRFCIGFERIVKAAILQFKEMGLSPIIYRAAAFSIHKRQHIKTGVHGTSPNKQYDYDHRFDQGIYLDKHLTDRKIEASRNAYEQCKEMASDFAGPAVIEIFGENAFEPKHKPECVRLDERQEALSVAHTTALSNVTNEYIKRDEYSFTIIAYPIPEIGGKYEEIFYETVKVNTLDKKLYQRIQQSMIDVLDQAEYVHVKGKGNNKTDIVVSMHDLADPAKETNFENCLADVNIPVGEVFTSPKLKGTNGVLNVSEVYLNDLRFVDLMIHFKDGVITEYNCKNFDTDEANKAFIKENLLMNRETLPIGEFAIGTNTTAYVMAQKYDIVYKLPILIVEKMGPHFAVGDTCYSHSEENQVYNPDGKKIVAKDNEFSCLRHEDLDKAYFNVHTDITIPYDELDFIDAVLPGKTAYTILKDGRFVLKGTEELNIPFEDR